jgi:hypothetical protein
MCREARMRFTPAGRQFLTPPLHADMTFILSVVRKCKIN